MPPRIDPAELDAVISRFVEDFQAIIRAQIEQTLGQAFNGAGDAMRERGPARRRAAVPEKRRVVARGKRNQPADAQTAVPAAGKGSRKKRAEQLSLF